MKRISFIVFALGFAALLVALLSGCRAEECRKMAACCEVIEDHEAVGNACGEMAEGVKDPTSCRTVLRAVEAMFEEREEELPAECRR